MSVAADYPIGSLKYHPNYPDMPTVAIRTKFEDEDDTSCTSWQTVNGSGNGSLFALHVQVDSWPDTAPGTPSFPEPPGDPGPIPAPE